jgi:LmbE family N-acetylglucosaminyl deacetylase
MSDLHDLCDVMFIGAHPDDETVMAGGVLALLHQNGVATHVVCATDGRGGESGGVPGADSPDTLARIREAELRCAVKALGATSLVLLGYEDPVIGPGETLYRFNADDEALARHIADQIRREGAEVVLTHGSNGEYGHPAHVQIHQAVLRAVRDFVPDVVVYGIAAQVPDIEDRLWNQDDPAHLALDITPWLEAKHDAIQCHRTQHELFKRRRELHSVRDAIRTVESFHRHWPTVREGTAPNDSFAALLRQLGAWQPDQARGA